MTQQEIKQTIDLNLSMIHQLTEASLTSFVLNEQIESLVAENRILSQKCKHEFKNGFCVYCYTKKE